MKLGFTAAGTQRFTVRVNCFGFVPLDDVNVTLTTIFDVATGRVALVFGLEAATMIENEVDRLDVLYGFGVRQIGIAYSEGNLLGVMEERKPSANA